jgi:glycosyltransferase involved in cell wall biosynthesis
VNPPTKTVLVQRYFPTYRRPIFEMLADHPDVDFLLLHGEQSGPGGLENVKGECRVRRLVKPTKSIGPGFLKMYSMPHMVEHARFGDYDVMIVSNDLHCLSIWPALYAAKHRRKKFMIFSIGFSQEPSFFRDAIRVWVARQCDAMVLYNQENTQKFIDKGVPGEKIFVAPNAIDTTAVVEAEKVLTQENLHRFQVENTLKEGVTIIHAGRMVERKRLDVLIRASAKLVSEGLDLNLVLIGDGPMLEPWKALASELKFQDRIRWPGAVYDQRDLCYWFHTSHLCVAPGQQGLIAHLSHAYGVPLITSDEKRLQGPELQVFQNGVTGILYRSGDTEDLALKIRILVEDVALRDRMAAACRKRIFSEFTIERMLQGFLESIQFAARQA